MKLFTIAALLVVTGCSAGPGVVLEVQEASDAGEPVQVGRPITDAGPWTEDGGPYVIDPADGGADAGDPSADGDGGDAGADAAPACTAIAADAATSDSCVALTDATPCGVCAGAANAYQCATADAIPAALSAASTVQTQSVVACSSVATCVRDSAYDSVCATTKFPTAMSCPSDVASIPVGCQASPGAPTMYCCP